MSDEYREDGRISNNYYESELARLQEELVALQDWIAHKGLRVAPLIEGMMWAAAESGGEK